MEDGLNSYHIDKFWKTKRYQKLFPVPLPFQTQVCNCSDFFLGKSQKIGFSC